ncbi:MAG: ATP-binding protein [Nitrospiraceae bacterium]|nr:ATP-binding protein [Nitrospiraceae bacterium]
MADVTLLNTAFDSFTKASRSLEACYTALQSRIETLTEELQDKNARLIEALREAEKNKDYLDAVLCSMEEAIIVLDHNEKVTMMNKSAARLLGLSEDEVGGVHYSGLPMAISENGAGLELKAGQKKYNVIVSDSPVVDSNGAARGRVIQIKDVTAMRQMEALHERNKRLISLGEMAATIVHEIRNPLCSIELFASMLERDVQDKEQKNLAGGISAGIHSLNNILTNMLFFARPQKPVMAQVDLRQISDDVLWLLSPLMESRGVKTQKKYTGDWVVRGDGELLKQTIMNLVINAAQAMPGGGGIEVCLRGEAGCTVLDIKDEGPGIEPENIEKIFDPFFSTKEKGSGLGLAIASRIMQAHGGYIRVTSDPGKGSIFSMHFTGNGGQY